MPTKGAYDHSRQAIGVNSEMVFMDLRSNRFASTKGRKILARFEMFLSRKHAVHQPPERD